MSHPRPVDGPVTLRVNGRTRTVEFVASDAPLLTVLRNDFELNGPKFGCGLGQCGACTVIVDGHATRACVVPAVAATGRDIVTLEGLGTPDNPHFIQRAFIEEQAAQCGYCLNGMIMSTSVLLERNPVPSDDEIRDALRYNLCRCGTHIEIMNAVRRAARYLQQQDEQ
ncbi:2Fe-2S iron-sulfur cluster binding domain-containing protein [Caballeronia sp. NK8]|jgi:nicotinate dehydrogenase subunit A|uniref:(2Fe-2S)-binding protein n=1 Tax=Caballeronia sp. NK8 TaxID=140098 RepID=UPI001BB7FAC9|nr:(2Fe-2S)-binding protein [Caballeronia sp. NK8]BCQ26550.1 2Fe-2S iron-sulfur cluster binding domain-containing protein [Caballeronia sp. NK8]